MRTLVVNAGSSSVKLRVLDADDAVLESTDLPARAGEAEPGAVRAAVEGLGPVDAVGHRIVHGGPHRTAAALVDDGLLAELRSLAPLAPLHQHAALDAIGAVAGARPATPAVACFDTAFHASLPAAASTYALPEEWRERWPIRRFGFHGLSHRWVAARVAATVGPGRRIVSCHLGSGASLAAIDGERSVDTTMGFTPLEGLVMGTRPGDVDPGLLLWLLGPGRLDLDELQDGLERRSGLLGLAGDADLRAVARRAGAGEAEAALALDVYLHRLRGRIGSMAASLGGLDVLAFTGGVGEHQAAVRAGAAAGLAFLGVGVDEALNDAAEADADVTALGSPVTTLVVTSREDAVIAGEVRALLAA